MDKELLVTLRAKQRRLDDSAYVITKSRRHSGDLVNHPHVFLMKADHTSFAHFALSHFELRLD
jgi:hypothetical protein